MLEFEHTDTPLLCVCYVAKYLVSLIDRMRKIGCEKERERERERDQRFGMDFVVKEVTFSFSAVISDWSLRV